MAEEEIEEIELPAEEKEVSAIDRIYLVIILNGISKYLNLATWVETNQSGFINYNLYLTRLLKCIRALDSILVPEIKKRLYDRLGVKLSIEYFEISEESELMSGRPFPRWKVREIESFCSKYIEALISVIDELYPLVRIPKEAEI